MMNTKTFSILVSCLLVSNFFIELHARNLQGANLQELGPYGGGIRRKRSVSEPILDLTLSAVKDLLIVRNTTSNRAILIDTQKEFILLLNGNSSSAVIISQNKNEGTLIHDGLWTVANQSLIQYLESIENNISSLLHRPGGVDFTLPKVSLNILQEISLYGEDLEVSLDPELKQHPELALELILSIASRIEDLLKGNLDGLLENIGDQKIELAIDLSGVKNVLEAMVEIHTPLQVNTRNLTKRNCDLDIGQILGARDGFSAFAQVLRQLGDTADLDLSPLDKLFGDPETLTRLIAQLGGQRSVGITGIFRVLSEIIAFTNENSNLARVISILITVVAQSHKEIKDNLGIIFWNSISNILELLNQIKTLKGTVNILEGLYDDKFIVDNVNLSNIISILLSSVTQPKEKLLSIVIKALKSLSPIVEPSRFLPELLLVLIVQLDSACGIENLILLGFDLQTSGCACSLLQTSLASASNLATELSQEIFDASRNLPNIGIIIDALEKAISVENLSLKELLNASDLVKNFIRGVFQLVSDTQLDVEQNMLDRCKDVIKSCNDVSTLVGVKVTVTISVISSS